MKQKYFACMILVMAPMFTATAAFAQETTPQRYAQALYLHVAPDKAAQFVEWHKTGNGMKAAKARMKADPNITGISVRSVAFANPTPRANYAMVTLRTGIAGAPDTAKRDAEYLAATGMNYAGYLTQSRTMSEVVGQTMSHLHDSTPDLQLSAGDVIVSRRMKTAEGKNTELADLNRKIRLSLMTENVKEGRLKGWAFGHLVLAGGTSLPWDATDTRVYKDLASAVGGPGGGGNANAAMALFVKMFPNLSYAKYQEDGRDLAKLVRMDTHFVVVSHRP